MTDTAKLKAAAERHELLGAPKHANQHRLSRLTMEVHNDELRIIAAAVESYTDELIAALEAMAAAHINLKLLADVYRQAYEEARAHGAEIEEAQSLHDEGVSMLCGQFDDLAAAMGWTSEIAMSQGVSQLEYARNLKARIAELEARTVTLPRPACTYADHSYPAYSEKQVIDLLKSAGINLETGGE